MESGNGGGPSEGVCLSEAHSSEELQSAALTLLHSSYLYEDSKELFTYNFTSLLKNPQLEEKYNAFRIRKRQAGYSEEDLEETYGFLLFDDIDKANALGETGLLTGNNDLTILGDPSKGVYISMYSDCLDPNHWCHPKSGHVVIIKLTKGKVKCVTENYTQTLTTPTEGFDCHVSESLSLVSSQTSSFLAFERTQYYIYEHLHNGSKEMAKSLSAACPFAIISFSYMSSKTTLSTHQNIREQKKPVGIYWPWRGQLQIGDQSFTVGLRSKAGALIPGKLPPVVKVCQAILVSDLQRSLPSTGFESCLTGEAFLDGFYCSLFELVSSQEEERDSFLLLLSSIRERNVALSVPLVDGGFLLLMHSSHLIENDDASSKENNVLQSLFVFPHSRVTVRSETNFECKSSTLSPEALQFVPALNYGEREVEKLATDRSEELCDVLLQHMQNYNLQSLNSKSVSPSVLQYDTHLCSCHQRSKEKTPQRLTSYLNRPAAFQLPVLNVSKILLAGQEELNEDMDEDACVYPLSSECMDLADPFEISTLGVLPPCQDNILKDLQTVDLCEQSKPCTIVSKLSKALIIEGKDLQTPPLPKTPPAELIVSITTAQQGIAGESVSMKSQIVPENSLYHQMEGKTNTSNFTNAICLKKKRATRAPRKKGKQNFSGSDRTANMDCKRKFRKLSPKCWTTDTETVTREEPSMPSTFSLELQLLPKQRTEHQRPVISQCGRILIPFGHAYIDKEITTLKRKLLLKNKKAPEKPLADNAMIETEPHSTTINTNNWSKPMNAQSNSDNVFARVVPQEEILNVVASSVDAVPLKPEQTKSDLTLLEKGKAGACRDRPSDAVCREKTLRSRGISLAKVRSCFAKRKRKSDNSNAAKITSKNAQIKPSMRKREISTSSVSSTSSEASKEINAVSGLVTLHDICETVLNPKQITETSTDLQKNKKCDLEQRTNSRSQDQKLSNRGTGIKRSPKKIKTLKPPPGIPAEKFKHEWWLHCRPPPSSEIETPQNEEFSEDISFSKTAGKEENHAFSPMDALNLLAELALGATSNTFPLQTNQTPEQNSKCPEDAIQEQPAIPLLPEGNPTQPTPVVRSPSPKLLSSNKELRALVSKDHMYSVQSSSLEATSVLPRTEDYLSESLHVFEEFKNTHVFADGESLRVIRQWPEQYDFDLDSRIVIGQKEKTIARVLHGPWAFPPQEDQSVRLIIHLWIGLFYTRSTPRFVEINLDPTSPSKEDNEAFKQSGTTSTFWSWADMSDSPLDLSKKSSSAPDPKSVIWDHFWPNVATPNLLMGKNNTLMEIGEKKQGELLISPQSNAEPYKGQRNFAQSKAISERTPTPESLNFKDSSSKDCCVIVDPQRQTLDSVDVSTQCEQKVFDYNQEVNRYSKSRDRNPVETYQTNIWEFQDHTTSKAGTRIPNVEDDKESYEDILKVDNFRPCQKRFACNDAVHKYSHVKPTSSDVLHVGSVNLAGKDSKCDMERCPGPDENTFLSAFSPDEDQINISAKASPALPKNIHNSKENLVKPKNSNSSTHLSNEGVSFSSVSAFPYRDIISDCAYFHVNEKQDLKGKEKDDKLFGRTWIPFVGLDTPAENALFLTSPLTDYAELPNKETLDKVSEKSDITHATGQIIDAKNGPQVVWRNELDDKSFSLTLDEKPHVSSASCSNRVNVQLSEGRRLVPTVTAQSLSNSVSCNTYSSQSNFSVVKPRVQGVSHPIEQLPYTNESNLFGRTNLKEFLNSVPVPKTNHLSYFLNRRHILDPPGYHIIESSNPLMAFSATSEHLNSASNYLVPSRQNKMMIGLKWRVADSHSHPSFKHQQESGGDDNNFPSVYIFPSQSCPLSNQIPSSIFSARLNKAHFKACKSSFKRTVSQIKSESSGTELVSLIEQLSQRYREAHLTEASLQHECFVFLDQIKCLVKKSTRGKSHTQRPRDNTALCRCKSLTSNFCPHKEQCNKSQDQKFEEEKTDRTCKVCAVEEEKGFHFQQSPLAEGDLVKHSRLGGVIAECARQFEAALHQICGTANLPASIDGYRTHTGPSIHFDYCSQMKRKLDQDFESDMNSLVKRSCTTKNRFFILETAECDFFKEVKAQLEAEGHVAVTPSEFFTEDISSLSSLIIILRNEDIAQHVCEVPHLLQLKKSPCVLFAGIDTPADVVNLTHREIFVHGGFILIDRAAQERLSLCSLKRIWEILKELNRRSKWKWMLHHRDSRRLKEDMSTSVEAKEKSLLVSRGQEAGLLHVLPYHECDLLSRDQPNYLACLLHLQVHKISYRHAVFVTDGNDEAMERNGIQTVTMNSFLTQWPNEMFTFRPQAPSSL